jgi:hypothetical protein
MTDTAPPLALDDVVRAWALLHRAVRDRRSALRTPVLASVGADGAARARTVVLRAIEDAPRLALLHTDVRSAKVAEIEAAPGVTLLAHDPRARLQVRLEARAAVERSGPRIDAARAALSEAALADYAGVLPPGAPLTGHRPARDPSMARQHLAVVILSVQSLETLQHTPEGWRRALGRPDGAGWAAHWLVP